MTQTSDYTYTGLILKRDDYDYELQQRPPGKTDWQHVRWYTLRRQLEADLERVRENYPNGEHGEWRVNRRRSIILHGPTEPVDI